MYIILLPDSLAKQVSVGLDNPWRPREVGDVVGVPGKACQKTGTPATSLRWAGMEMSGQGREEAPALQWGLCFVVRNMWAWLLASIAPEEFCQPY